MIHVQEVTKYFGNAKAVDRISFEVQEAETLVLLGTSGCGKTTTLRMINRLVETDEGVIFINKEDIRSQQAEILRQKIGYVIQQTGLFPHYTVAENIAVVPRLLRWKETDIQNRIRELLKMFRLSESILTQYPSQLSGGQQQRVGLARALASDPPILLMDEPFGALDQITRNAIRQEFKTLEALQRKTILLVTHDVQEAFELGNRIGIMDKGKIQQLGTPKELLFQPANKFVSTFLSDQRLVLEMKTIKVKDLLSDSHITDSLADPTWEISEEISLWDLLQKKDKIKTSYAKIKMKDNWHTIDLGKVWQEFYKKSLI